jgi:hypothetical protein
MEGFLKEITMLLTRVKKAIEIRNSTGKKIPDDDALADLVYEAMVIICGLCKPAELVRDFGDDVRNIFRLIEGGKYISFPEYPDFTKTERHLNIDEHLTFAVVNYTCFLIGGDPKFKITAEEIVGAYKTNYSLVSYGEN